jgi:hypothetical protein
MKISEQLLYLNVKNNPAYNSAITNGVIKIGFKEYMYVRSHDALIIKDFYPQYKQRKADGETWEQFVEFAKQHTDGISNVKVQSLR